MNGKCSSLKYVLRSQISLSVFAASYIRGLIHKCVSIQGQLLSQLVLNSLGNLFIASDVHCYTSLAGQHCRAGHLNLSLHGNGS